MTEEQKRELAEIESDYGRLGYASDVARDVLDDEKSTTASVLLAAILLRLNSIELAMPNA